ncbi:kinase-like domain-containing protein [Thermothelomyces heterothallicus CBS 202.75]|uniref:kinase-like domain-containing protein n=1 Tax=Thermothelomyces heterothallicus CBS 202.75 TaxID=1149848 RepID=UPI00374298C6
MSPTPAERDGRQAAVGRRTSTRLALRSQSAQYRNLDDSSDDEVLSPMKLSAITKALLGAGHVSDASSTNVPATGARHSPEPLRSSVPAPVRATTGDQESSWKRTRDSNNAPASQSPTPPSGSHSRISSRRGSIPAPVQPASRDQESPVQAARVTRHSRRGSTHSSRNPSPVGSRDNSPAPRKRVVRLNAPSSANGASGSRRNSLRNSFSSSSRGKRPESADGSRAKTASSPAAQQDRPAKTPVLPVRTVRIAVGSSGQKPPSGASSDARPTYTTRSSEVEGRNASAAAIAPPIVAPQASLRVKRVGRTPGSFLSGPARRGRRRQSEDDADGPFEADAPGSGNEPGSQQAREEEQQEEVAPSAASEYPDFAASGSPVSAKDSARAALRRHRSTFITPVSQRKPEHHHLPLAFQDPSPPVPDSAEQDKENEGPSEIAPVIPASMRAANPPPSAINQRAPPQSVAPSNPEAVEPHGQAHGARNNHVLTARSHNIPQRPAPPPPPKMSVVETATAAAGASTAAQASKKRQFLLRVNGKMYTRIDSLGRGGSGKVYRVSAENGKLLALKRVSLENLDERTIKGYHGEIDLLQRLAGVNRVIQLIDHEFNAEKQTLSLVLEAGELDFNTFLRSRLSEDCRFDPVFVRYWWKEMVECVQAVHEKDIIHTDLKPANFVLAQGRLKVIDFGIANAIQTDMTVNVHRDAQIGTPNYMSPESLMDFKEYALTSAYNGQVNAPPLQRPKHFKLGKASDIWSLGCILYQMVYGQCPFARITNMMARVNAIKDWSHAIEFPEHTEHGIRVPPSLLRTMKRCLNRDQTQRPTCEELLCPTDPFLYPMELSSDVFTAADHGKVIPITQELLRDVVWDVAQRVRRGDAADAEVLKLWPAAYWASCKKSLAMRSGAGPGGAAASGNGAGAEKQH